MSALVESNPCVARNPPYLVGALPARGGKETGVACVLLYRWRLHLLSDAGGSNKFHTQGDSPENSNTRHARKTTAAAASVYAFPP